MTTITEDQPMTYTARDGARIELRVAGLERVFTLTVSGERLLTTVNEQYARTQARAQAEAHNARAAVERPATAQIESPLPAAERCASGLARGATLTMPSEPQARALDSARGVVLRYGSSGVGLTVLRSLARRGWVVLDDRIRPAHGVITSNGRKALARYEASRAGAR